MKSACGHVCRHADVAFVECEADTVNEPGWRVCDEACPMMIKGTPSACAEAEALIRVDPLPLFPVAMAALSDKQILPALQTRFCHRGGPVCLGLPGPDCDEPGRHVTNVHEDRLAAMSLQAIIG